MSRILFLSGLIALAALVILASGRLFAAPSQASGVKIQFVSYIQSGLPEQDVFIEPGSVRAEMDPSLRVISQRCNPSVQFAPGFLRPWMVPPSSDQCAPKVDVVRAEPQDALLPTMLAKPLYAASKVIPHDPNRVGPSPLGPFREGQALGLTWGEWLAATGSGTYTVSDKLAQLDVAFTRLIPNATYSLWCGRETPPPNYSSIEAPCGSADGSQNQFRADAAGEASLHVQFKALPASTADAATVLLLSYDRVVLSTDQELGGYGYNNHTQLYFTFP